MAKGPAMRARELAVDKGVPAVPAAAAAVPTVVGAYGAGSSHREDLRFFASVADAFSSLAFESPIGAAVVAG